MWKNKSRIDTLSSLDVKSHIGTNGEPCTGLGLIIFKDLTEKRKLRIEGKDKIKESNLRFIIHNNT